MSDIVQRLISAAEDFPEIDENPSYLYCAASVEIQHLTARLAAAEANVERMANLCDDMHENRDDPDVVDSIYNHGPILENRGIFARRYAWFREHASLTSGGDIVFGSGLRQHEPEILDAAIDAARGGE